MFGAPAMAAALGAGSHHTGSRPRSHPNGGTHARNPSSLRHRWAFPSSGSLQGLVFRVEGRQTMASIAGNSGRLGAAWVFCLSPYKAPKSIHSLTTTAACVWLGSPSRGSVRAWLACCNP